MPKLGPKWVRPMPAVPQPALVSVPAAIASNNMMGAVLRSILLALRGVVWMTAMPSALSRKRLARAVLLTVIE